MRFRAFLLLLWIFGAAFSHAETVTIGVGRDFYDGTDSRAFLHGSTGTWEALTYLDAHLRAVPWLAESWQSGDDGKRWVFRIRDGVRFHDGTPMTHIDVAASIRRIITHPKYDIAGNYRVVKSVTTKGKQDVVFELAEPVPYFPRLTAYYSSPVIKPSCIEKDGNIRTLIATGPYKLKKVAPSDRIELEAFDAYWGEKPLYSRVVFKTVIDAQSRLMALMAGELDVVADVGAVLPEQAPQIRACPDLVLKQVQVATTHIVIFNSGKPPFSEKESRLWLAGAVERKKLIDAFAKDAGIEAFDPYTPLASDFAFGLIHPEKRAFPGFRIEAPLEILLQSATLQRWPYLEIAQIVQQQLKENGVDARIRIEEPGAYHDAVKKGDFHLAIQPYTLMSGDPDFFYAYWIASDAPRNCGWKNDAVDRLIVSARHEMDEQKRRSLYQELAKQVADNLPILPLYHDVSLYACARKCEKLRMDHFFKPCLMERCP